MSRGAHGRRELRARWFLRRDVRRRAPSAAGMRLARAYAGRASRRGPRSPAALRRARDAAHGHHVQRVRARRGYREDPPVRSRAAGGARVRMDDDRAGPGAARARAEPLHRRHLPREARHLGRRRPSGDHRERVVVPAGVPRPRSASGRLGAHHGDRPGSALRRALLRARGQPAVSVGRFVRAAQPPGDEAHVPEGLRGFARAPGRRVSERAAPHAAARAASRRRPRRPWSC